MTWNDIKNYEGYYQVSNTGDVRSVDRYVKAKNGGVKHQRGKLLVQHKDSDGYLCVCLTKDHKPKSTYVHRLVAQAFLPNPNEFSEVNHKDENKENNYVCLNDDGSVNIEKSNLEWCAREYNINYGSANYRKQTRMIEYGKSKVVEQINTLGSVINTFVSVGEAGRQTGINPANISRCCNGFLKTAGGYIWRFQ